MLEKIRVRLQDYLQDNNNVFIILEPKEYLLKCKNNQFTVILLVRMGGGFISID